MISQWKVVRSDSACVENAVFSKQGHECSLCPLALSPGEGFYHSSPTSSPLLFPIFSCKFLHRFLASTGKSEPSPFC